MTIIETERLVIRECTADDGPFVLALLNSPKFVQFIGDRGVRSVPDAERYIAERFVASYRTHGYGLYAVVSKDGSQTIGLCGLVNRPSLDHPDIGFAFLPEFEGHGYGFESATAIITHSLESLNIRHLLAITTLNNQASIALLGKLGFAQIRVIEENGEQLNLFELILGTDA